MIILAKIHPVYLLVLWLSLCAVSYDFPLLWSSLPQSILCILWSYDYSDVLYPMIVLDYEHPCHNPSCVSYDLMIILVCCILWSSLPQSILYILWSYDYPGSLYLMNIQDYNYPSHNPSCLHILMIWWLSWCILWFFQVLSTQWLSWLYPMRN